MTITELQTYIDQGKPLEGEEVISFMVQLNDEVRKLQIELNTKYHTREEITRLFSQIIGQEVDPSFCMWPPFYADFGRNIHVGKDVFINADCKFQDWGGIYIGDHCLIGHGVVMATLDHFMEPDRRSGLIHAPIRLGKNVWVGSNSTITSGVTIGDNAVIAAGAVVVKDVPANEVWGGVPAKFIKKI
ncbi:MAG: sugar O-acetyltransferase [Muribaculaceae bacterium]|nr:sugar O-acetyltransferase [Muribaculaceae bacterium]